MHAISMARQTSEVFVAQWERKDKWRATVDFNLLVMVDYNFKG